MSHWPVGRLAQFSSQQQVGYGSAELEIRPTTTLLEQRLIAMWALGRVEELWDWQRTVRPGNVPRAWVLSWAVISWGTLRRTATCHWLAGLISVFLIQTIAYHFWVTDICTAAISYIIAVKDQNILCNCSKGVGIGVWTTVAVSTSSARAKDILPWHTMSHAPPLSFLNLFCYTQYRLHFQCLSHWAKFWDLLSGLAITCWYKWTKCNSL